MGKKKNVYQFLICKLEGKRPTWRIMLGFEDNIKMYLKLIGEEGVYQVRLAQDKDKRDNEVAGSTKFKAFLEKLRTYKLLKNDCFTKLLR